MIIEIFNKERKWAGERNKETKEEEITHEEL